MSESKVRIQDDLYEYVNGEWMKNAVIPQDRPTAGGFSDLDLNVEKLLMQEFKDFSLNKNSTDIKEMSYAVEMYKKFIDVKRRNSEGIKPVLPLLDKIKGIKTISDLNAISKDLFLSDLCLPFNMGVTVDMGNTTKYCLFILGPSIILPDTPYYADDNQTGKQLLSVWSTMAKNALEKTNLSKQEQEEYLLDTLKFDSLVAKKVKNKLEWSEYTKCYNPTPLKDVVEYLKPFDLTSLLNSLFDKLPDTICVYDPKAIKEFRDYFNEDNLNIYVHWLYVKTLLNSSKVLSEELANNSNLYMRTLLGVEKEGEIEKKAYQFVSKFYSEPIGVYYGRKYFGEEAKKDVISLAKKIIDTYKSRVKKNTFLEEKTKEEAIKKLSAIEIKMGYPDSIRDIYNQMYVLEEDSLYDCVTRATKTLVLDNLNDLYHTVDRTRWGMPGHMVNACYNPSDNDITFPAAILQKPFYSINQSVSENLGGIGAVIGHEISHAFDNNGSHFDEKGNLANWWTEKDFAEFEKLTQKMTEQWDGLDYHGGKVNGKLVVSENIADNGGMAVTIEIMHHTKDADFKEYFKNWARIWCLKAKEEYISYLLANDVHSPAGLRANIQPRNFDEWYEAFGVTKDDKMFIEPSKRVIIW